MLRTDAPVHYLVHCIVFNIVIKHLMHNRLSHLEFDTRTNFPIDVVC